MARIILPGEIAGRFNITKGEFDLPANSMRELYRKLDDEYPGLGEELQKTMFAILDGEIVQDAFLETLSANTEVNFMPLIKGG